jgi:hypothetical protein
LRPEQRGRFTANNFCRYIFGTKLGGNLGCGLDIHRERNSELSRSDLEIMLDDIPDNVRFVYRVSQRSGTEITGRCNRYMIEIEIGRRGEDTIVREISRIDELPHGGPENQYIRDSVGVSPEPAPISAERSRGRI